MIQFLPFFSLSGVTLVKNVRATTVELKSANLRRLAPFFSALCRVAPFFSGLNVGPAALYGYSALHGQAAHIQRQSQRTEKCHFMPFIAVFFQC
jgi:hypothetical protein